MPPILIWLYNREKSIQAFDNIFNKGNWKNKISIQQLIIILFSILSMIIDFGMIFLNGVFPFYGSLYSGLKGIVLIEIHLLLLTTIIITSIKKIKVGWWISLLYYCSIIISLMITFLNNEYSEVLNAFSFHKYELSMIQNIPITSIMILLALTVPILPIIIVIAISKNEYKNGIIRTT
jgi:hypothetical protein